MDVASPQPTDAHIRIAHSITEAIMMRDFSKRQRAILDLILRLSWGCGRKYAIIPMQKDFRIVGIAETKVKSELEWLINANVIECCKEANTYSFLKDFDKWAISLVSDYNRKRFDELLHINLTSQIGNLLPKTESEETSQNGNELYEKGRNFPKNREVAPDANTDEKPICGQSKESNKESINIYSSFFEKIWTLYPNKKGKAKIKDTQKKKLYSIGLDEISRCIERYKKSKPDWQAWQNGSTFFNMGYLDYMDAAFQDFKDYAIEHEASAYRDLTKYEP